MTAQNDSPIVLLEIEQQMRHMLEGCVKPYDAGRAIWKTAMSSMADASETMHPLWLVWGALTDWVEVKPLEEQKAESAMLRASQEWLALKYDDAESKSAYFDKWIYGELGYQRAGK